MMKRIIPVIILLAAIAGGYWWFTRTPVAASEPSVLIGSGTIEAETVAITAELGGRVIELKVDEGDEVTAGQVLVELDKADLLAQKTQLETALATAKANLALVSASARAEDVAAAQARLAQAETAREGARLTWQRVQALVNDPHELEIQINQARARVTEVEHELELARVQVKRLEIQAEAASRNQTTVMAGNEGLVGYETAQYQLQAARMGVEMAEVALAGAKKQVEHLIALRDRPLPLIAQANAARATYDQAEAAVLVAEANLVAAKADPMPEDMAVAQAQVLEAQAALETVNVQLAKQTLTAPRNGLISQRLVESGELATPGAVLLELSDIETVDLMVYIPETHLGQVKIGQQARVYVDAYENQVFEGLVSFIAHEAEFTPKNVQTQEERVNLVFAVKITLDNADHRLKPGMPADAEILPASQPVAVKAPLPTAPPQKSFTASASPTPITVEPPPTAKLTPTTPVEAVPTSQAEVIAWSLNVRSGPGLDHAIIASLVQGDVVPILDTDPDTGWLQVRLPGSQETGWITGSPTFVLVKDKAESDADPGAAQPTPTVTATPVPAEVDLSKQAEVVSIGLNVRSGPGVTHPTIANLAKGYTMPVLEIDPASGWLQVELPGYGKTGWVSGDPAYVLVK